jgi:O-antigen ligase
MPNMYRKIADTWAARLLMVCFFLPMALQVTALIAAAVYFISTKFIDRYKAPIGSYGWSVILSAGYYLYLLWYPSTPQPLTGEISMLCGNRLSYLFMPFFFAAISPEARANIRGQLMWFVYGCLVCCLLANYRYIYTFCVVPGTIQHLFHVQYRMYIEEVSGIHPTYMSMYICFSICVLLLDAPGKMRAWVKYILLYILLLLLFSLLAKSALLAICIILVHYAYVQRHLLLRSKWQLAAGLVAMGGTIYLIPFSRQRIGEVFQFAGIGKHGGDVTDNSMFVRKVIWNTDMQMLHKYWLGGVGPGVLNHALSIRYFFFSIAHNFAIGYYDPHNEYLSEWLSFGLLGIVVSVSVLTVHITKALRRADHLYLYLMIILCITFATETVLARQYGVIFYAVLTSLFFFTAKQTKVE